jgi:DNA modification methylase
MKTEMVATKEIIPYARNPRKNEDAIAKVSASLKEYGWQQPIVVDAEMVIIAGHTRLEAAKRLKMEKVPIHIADKLTEAQVKAFRIADNRVSQEAEWDMDLLKIELGDLEGLDFDLSLTGFDDDELNALMLEAVEEGLTDDDEVPEAPENPVSVLGDVWTLGNHRLMCGDSTSVDDVDKLINKEKIDVVFTDPPYNIDYQGVRDKRDKIKNDKMSDEDFVDFLSSSLYQCETMYVCCSWQYAHLFRQAMEKIGAKPKSMIIWDKVNPAQHLDKYFKQHEIIYYHGEFGGQKTIRGDVWKLKRQKNTLHPTMKPIELIEMALGDCSGKRVVYDAFGGFGSTLIACEKTGRDCRMMELDETYADIIICRWQNFTGKEATHEETGKTYNEMKAERDGSK